MSNPSFDREAEIKAKCTNTKCPHTEYAKLKAIADETATDLGMCLNNLTDEELEKALTNPETDKG